MDCTTLSYEGLCDKHGKEIADKAPVVPPRHAPPTQTAKLPEGDFQHPYLLSLAPPQGKGLELQAERDCTLLDTCLPESRLNIRSVVLEFTNITAQSGNEFRYLNLASMTVAQGRPPKTAVVDIDAIKPHYVARPLYICACLLYEFPVGTGLEKILPAFRNLIYSKCFFHVPEHITKELVTPYNYIFVPGKSLYGFFDKYYKLSMFRWTDSDALCVNDGPIFKHTICEDAVLVRVWREMNRGDSLERFDELLHDPKILTRNRSYVKTLTRGPTQQYIIAREKQLAKYNFGGLG